MSAARRHRLCTALGALALAALPVPARGWTAAAHDRIAALAVQTMPPALAGLLVRHRDALAEGLLAPDRVEAARSHALNLDGSPGDLDQRVAAAVDSAIATLHDQGSFADFARELGVLSHLAADAAFPLNTSEGDPREGDYYADYSAFCEARMSRFPAVFNGYSPVSDPAAYVRGVAERANRAYPFIQREYFPGGGARMRSSRSFDDRGPAFGVAQLSFSHAVSATASLWLHVWSQGRGDLQGIPFKPAGGLQGATGRAGAAQRP